MRFRAGVGCCEAFSPPLARVTDRAEIGHNVPAEGKKSPLPPRDVRGLQIRDVPLWRRQAPCYNEKEPLIPAGEPSLIFGSSSPIS
jgi:hypothetical protein